MTADSYFVVNLSFSLSNYNAGEKAAEYLGDDQRSDPRPREFTDYGEGQGHGWIQVGRAHEGGGVDAQRYRQTPPK